MINIEQCPQGHIQSIKISEEKRFCSDCMGFWFI